MGIRLLRDFVKLMFCGVVFFMGMIAGGILASSLGLPVPDMPAGVDVNTVLMYFLLTSPILAFALAILARGISGSFAVRVIALAVLTWMAYCVNTQLEASIFIPGSVSLYSVVAAVPQSLLFAAAIAWLFPPDEKGQGLGETIKAYFASRRRGEWGWRLPFVCHILSKSSQTSLSTQECWSHF